MNNKKRMTRTPLMTKKQEASGSLMRTYKSTYCKAMQCKLHLLSQLKLKVLVKMAPQNRMIRSKILSKRRPKRILTSQLSMRLNSPL